MSLENWAADVIPEGMQQLFPKGSTFRKDTRKPVLRKWDAPGYRTIKTEYTCIPDVAHPWDPEVVKAIWKFAPDFVPMWERRVLLPQGAQTERDAIILGRHALGRVIRNQHGWLPELRVSMPSMPCQGLTFDRPNDLAFIHEDELEEGQSKDLPGPYLPFDHSIVMKALDLAIGFNMTEKEYKEFLNETIVEDDFAAFVKRMMARFDEADARDREFLPYAQKQIDRISDVEAKEYMRSVGSRERPRRSSIIVP